jgi:hypothetical protein
VIILQIKVCTSEVFKIADCTSEIENALSAEMRNPCLEDGSGFSTSGVCLSDNPGDAVATAFPLEITQPRVLDDSVKLQNRFYKAYPYTYSLTAVPNGMTIDADKGEISCASPAASNTPYNVTARVMDSNNNVETISWTVLVITNGFKFVDSANGNDSNSGSIDSP